jgi:hypothetical protein
MSSIRQAQEVLRTGFEAVDREIPRAQQVKAAWLDKIYRQNPPFTSYLWGKSKVWGISFCGRNDTACVLPIGGLRLWMPKQLQKFKVAGSSSATLRPATLLPCDLLLAT